MIIDKKVLTACLLALCALAARAQDAGNGMGETRLFLFGTGVYENLGEDIYIGAVYVPPLDVEIKPGASRRMEMRISAESLSARRFTRFWMDAITLNTNREQRAGLAGEIQTFGELFQREFLRGDRIAFDFDKAAGATAFLFNGVEIGKISGAEFFEVLINGWIGDTPPSMQLKSGLLNGLSEQELAHSRQRFDALVYSERRLAEIRVEQERAREARALQAEAERLAEDARLAEEKRQAEQAALAEQARQAELERQRALAEAEAAALAAEESREDEAAFEAAQQALADAYRAELAQWLGKHVVYPERALKFGLEARLELAIIMDRAGQVLSTTVSQNSGSGLFAEAALDMLERAQPLPPMPEDLAGESFEWVMPLNFSLKN